MDVEANGAHVLFTEDTLLGCPLEASHNAVLDLIKVLYSLGHIHQKVGASSIRSKAPDLSGLTDIPFILFSKVACTGLQLLTTGHITFLNILCQAISEGTG